MSRHDTVPDAVNPQTVSPEMATSTKSLPDGTSIGNDDDIPAQTIEPEVLPASTTTPQILVMPPTTAEVAAGV